MEFSAFNQRLMDHVYEMTKDGSHLFEVNLDKDRLWNLYLNSFPSGMNETYRERREFDCNCCRRFIEKFGNVVSIKDGKLTTIWDFDANSPNKFQPVIDVLDAFVRLHSVSDVFYTKWKDIGTKMNYEDTEYGPRKWFHFYVLLPDRFVCGKNISEGDYKAQFRDTKNVFKRSLEELTTESVNVVLELIASGTLYRGEEWKYALQEFLGYKRKFDAIRSQYGKDAYAWEMSVKAGPVIGRIRNHSIGTLLIDLSEGMDVEQAVTRYEKVVAPTNYKRPKAIFTKKMLEDAQKTVMELGFMDSLPRRHAKMDDITANNVLFSNRDAAKRIQGGDVFASMMNEASKKPMNFDRVEEIPYDKFIRDVLPTASEVEVYLENRHAKNMVSLVAPQNPTAPSMLKWNNNFSWAYAGNVTDSLKENVAKAGGNVDGVLRFSIQWNDVDYNPNDFDAHCVFLNGRTEIYFGNKYDHRSHGRLDVDIIEPRRGSPAVENITWPSVSFMPTGNYVFFVHCFSNRGGTSGFKAEIEFDGQIFTFEYPHSMHTDEEVKVATVCLDANGKFTIVPHLKADTYSKDIWNLKTNDFVPVSMMMYSPNYWDEQKGIGHRHVFFMLKDCRNPEDPNGFYNEFLSNDLAKHKRVFEALGSRMRAAYEDDQLSGIGFSTTKRDDVVVRVTGATKRVFKIKF